MNTTTNDNPPLNSMPATAALEWRALPIADAARDSLRGTKVLACRAELTPRGITVDFRPDWESLHGDWAGTDKNDVPNDPTIRAYRELQTRLGLKDTPVSVQVIIQRFLIGPNLTRVPQINLIVDAVNVAAVLTKIPLGVFDADCVEGDIVLDRASGCETYVPMAGKSSEPIPAGAVVLRDDKKVLSRFCYRDSEAQKIKPETRRIWLLGCLVPGVMEDEVQRALTLALEKLSTAFNVQIVPHQAS